MAQKVDLYVQILCELSVTTHRAKLELSWHWRRDKLYAVCVEKIESCHPKSQDNILYLYIVYTCILYIISPATSALCHGVQCSSLNFSSKYSYIIVRKYQIRLQTDCMVNCL